MDTCAPVMPGYRFLGYYPDTHVSYAREAAAELGVVLRCGEEPWRTRRVSYAPVFLGMPPEYDTAPLLVRIAQKCLSCSRVYCDMVRQTCRRIGSMAWG